MVRVRKYDILNMINYKDKLRWNQPQINLVKSKMYNILCKKINFEITYWCIHSNKIVFSFDFFLIKLSRLQRHSFDRRTNQGTPQLLNKIQYWSWSCCMVEFIEICSDTEGLQVNMSSFFSKKLWHEISELVSVVVVVVAAVK